MQLLSKEIAELIALYFFNTSIHKDDSECIEIESS